MNIEKLMLEYSPSIKVLEIKDFREVDYHEKECEVIFKIHAMQFLIVLRLNARCGEYYIKLLNWTTALGWREITEIKYEKYTTSKLESAKFDAYLSDFVHLLKVAINF